MKPFVALAVLALFVACSIPLCREAQAQTRWSSDQLQQMQEKAKLQLRAFQRFELSEREARDEGNPDQAARYRAAKEQALEAYTRLDAEYQKALAERKEYDRKNETSREK